MARGWGRTKKKKAKKTPKGQGPGGRTSHTDEGGVAGSGAGRQGRDGGRWRRRRDGSSAADHTAPGRRRAPPSGGRPPPQCRGGRRAARLGTSRARGSGQEHPHHPSAGPKTAPPRGVPAAPRSPHASWPSSRRVAPLFSAAAADGGGGRPPRGTRPRARGGRRAAAAAGPAGAPRAGTTSSTVGGSRGAAVTRRAPRLRGCLAFGGGASHTPAARRRPWGSLAEGGTRIKI